MVKKILCNIQVLIIILFLLTPCMSFAESEVEISRLNNNLIFSGNISGLSYGDNIGVMILKEGITPENLLSQSGSLTDNIIYSGQIKASDNGEFSLSVPFDDRFPFGNSTVYFGSPKLDSLISGTFKIVKITVTGENASLGSSDKTGEIKHLSGDVFMINLTPDNNVAIDYLKVNNKTAVSKYSGSFSYSAGEIYEDTKVEYGFYEYTPEVFTPEEEPPEYSMSDIQKALTAEEKKLVLNKLTAFMAAKVPFVANNLKLYQFGVLISPDLSAINANASECLNAQGQKISSSGSFGILFCGTEDLEGKSYYAKAYATYRSEDGEKEQTYYGTIKQFTLGNEIQGIDFGVILDSFGLVSRGIRIYRID